METPTVAYAPNSSSEYAAFLEVLAGALKGAPVGDSVVLLGDLKAYDWVPWDVLREVLQEYRVRGSLLRAIQSLYSQS